MTQEEKDLLLKDLCARLPYQPICEFTDTEDDFCTATAALGYSLRDFIAGKVLIKPYLRPMSSMTEEEKVEWQQVFELELKALETNEECTIANAASSSFEIDFYNKYHFDYRGLIEKRLALEAPKGMYNN